jgi:hypothetical protein
MNRAWTANEIADRLETLLVDLKELGCMKRDARVSSPGRTAHLDADAVKQAIEAVRTLAMVKGLLS